jgi:hypothetical protein
MAELFNMINTGGLYGTRGAEFNNFNIITVDIVNNYKYLGYNLIHICANLGKVDLLYYVLHQFQGEVGANINLPCDSIFDEDVGKTPIILAAQACKTDVIYLLLNIQACDVCIVPPMKDTFLINLCNGSDVYY